MKKNHGYIPNTEIERGHMFEFLGIRNIESLFLNIPESARLKRDLALPPAWSEIELNKKLKAMAAKNADLEQYISFLGAGAYEHYIPAIVDSIISRSEFYTAYTPYQPEISQGLLQAIFEYQTMICELTGMDVSNASMYDGPTAMAEAGIMACVATGRSKLLVSRAVHPEYRDVLKTYACGKNIQIEEVIIEDGLTAIENLESKLADDVAAVIVQYPNFFGGIEDIKNASELVHKYKALFITVVNPIALGILEAPGECGADIVVAEGQPLGNPISFGGPHLGILATTNALMRRMPGRIIGQTKDMDGRRAFVLTLQAREQHIRREKATSNICSNQALSALAATVFLSYMGKQGLQDIAKLNVQKAHYAYQKLIEIPGIQPLFHAPFFNEFAVRLDKNVGQINRRLLQSKIIGGFDVGRAYAEYKDSMLLTVTELRTKEEIDLLVQELGAIV
ncbi:aminomethyl-transferring glycine dehydrogenase subunit GcvPA [Aneurinibacillus migulanus]|uniref:Probable glycine dehydrogenase (decarboxylating) subunit 1 n=2 Tax=Aneurinibacillus migulanus TaxID=47500 RepID=A0A1G8Q0P1_ANEMI|nr:aminomethyl-transferring glycine dehydrogenase subunit GcvPA [Aneurinibacillus migulanus]KIV57827.1 glycine dehydrogenase [Aneurinibacillus migulanus]MED0895982.1 aminomethyl-transferring glycine dehydrogenase subunit GcvPA [Aneurinibacillus migulanus]MED1616656.1 aminomethyl-transferring glycine dehydrogenase subunit GcvPA [Aneurinibacillus migulanus]SDI98267.1 glycine dehydrogenase subunit 1 [Aneurinibacillus migulanus]GED13491.1 putative glycine dehydrogenase subunit 1 [Aneurinibacillus 